MLTQAEIDTLTAEKDAIETEISQIRDGMYDLTSAQIEAELEALYEELDALIGPLCGKLKVEKNGYEDEYEKIQRQIIEYELLLETNTATFSADRDGLNMQTMAMTPAQAFWNLAMLPGWQKWKPTYRYGTISKIDYVENTAKVTLDEVRSVSQEIDINNNLVFEDVPIEYMTCNAGAFENNDRVLVRFMNQDPEDPRVIGFEKEPKPCASVFIFITGYYESENEKYCIVWDVKQDERVIFYDDEGVELTEPCPYAKAIADMSGLFDFNGSILLQRKAVSVYGLNLSALPYGPKVDFNAWDDEKQTDPLRTFDQIVTMEGDPIWFYTEENGRYSNRKVTTPFFKSACYNPKNINPLIESPDLTSLDRMRSVFLENEYDDFYWQWSGTSGSFPLILNYMVLPPEIDINYEKGSIITIDTTITSPFTHNSIDIQSSSVVMSGGGGAGVTSTPYYRNVGGLSAFVDNLSGEGIKYTHLVGGEYYHEEKNDNSVKSYAVAIEAFHYVKKEREAEAVVRHGAPLNCTLTEIYKNSKDQTKGDLPEDVINYVDRVMSLVWDKTTIYPANGDYVDLTVTHTTEEIIPFEVNIYFEEKELKSASDDDIDPFDMDRHTGLSDAALELQEFLYKDLKPFGEYYYDEDESKPIDPHFEVKFFTLSL